MNNKELREIAKRLFVIDKGESITLERCALIGVGEAILKLIDEVEAKVYIKVTPEDIKDNMEFKVKANESLPKDYEEKLDEL